MKNALIENRKSAEKVLLVMIDFKKERSEWGRQQDLAEMTELIRACDGEVVGHIRCSIDTPTAGFLISKQKVKDIAEYCSVNSVDTVIFSHDLKGSQQRNVEEMINIKTIDRTQLILDIFARHASSKEGKMQVELAQLEYLLPRLVGKGIELSRLGGGIGTLGPGETKLEVDRRRISQRITRLKKDLNDVAAKRALTRKHRRDQGVPVVSLVGYTNVGKSTLLNILTEAGQITRDGYFTTLDPLARQLVLPNHQKIIITDTVGFMHNLPLRLIEAFHATLEGIKEADLLLHVVDVSHPNFRLFYNSVNEVLKEIESFDKKTVLVLNKIDQLQDREWLKEYQKNFEYAVCLSAKTGENVKGLLDKLSELLSSLVIEINVEVPIDRMDLVSLAHREGEVYSVKYYAQTINIRALVPRHIAGRFYK